MAMMKYLKSTKYGLDWEKEMMIIHQDYFKGEIRKASKIEDMRQHIDFWWRQDKNSPWISYDVKAIKRSSRKAGFFDGTIHWLELQNTVGNLGWIYGKEDYVIFTTEDTAIYVRTKKLPLYIEPKIKGKKIVNSTPYEFYIPYQRPGNRDLIVKVPTYDLRKIADFEIKLPK